MGEACSFRLVFEGSKVHIVKVLISESKAKLTQLINWL